MLLHLQTISISNKCYSFELSINQKNPGNKSITVSINIKGVMAWVFYYFNMFLEVYL